MVCIKRVRTFRNLAVRWNLFLSVCHDCITAIGEYLRFSDFVVNLL
jgi:hypothetical protein